MLTTRTAADLRRDNRGSAFGRWWRDVGSSLGAATASGGLLSGARARPTAPRRAVLVGAGPPAAHLATAMLADPTRSFVPIAVLDDDPQLVGRSIGGLAVSGSTVELAAVAISASARAVVLTDPQADAITIQALAAQATAAGLELFVLPPPSEAGERVDAGDLRPPTIEDLYARDPVAVDPDLLGAGISGRRVLVFGAAGSIGAALTRHLLGLQPAALVLADHDENGLNQLLHASCDGALDLVTWAVADVRDRGRIFELFERHRPEVVFHAAALNHRSFSQPDVGEAIKTNTVGTKNLLDAAVDGGVRTFVHLSSAAAADPSTPIGATKLSAERLTALAAAETGWRYLTVRTAGSIDGRGSALTAFRRQLQAGRPLTVPHPDTTQLLLSSAEAARLVLLATAIGEPGQVLVPDAGYPVHLADLARHVVGEARAQATNATVAAGIEPGPTRHEVLFGPNEVGVTGLHPRVVHLAPELRDPCPALAEATGIGEAEIRAMISAGSRLRVVEAASVSQRGNGH